MTLSGVQALLKEAVYKRFDRCRRSGGQVPYDGATFRLL